MQVLSDALPFTGGLLGTWTEACSGLVALGLNQPAQQTPRPYPPPSLVLQVIRD